MLLLSRCCEARWYYYGGGRVYFCSIGMLLVAGLSITDMDLTNGSRSVPRYGSISLRSVYESAASFISGLRSPTNYCAATRTGTASAFGPGTIRREGRGIGLDHVVGVHRAIDLELLHMRLGHPGIEAMDPLCMDDWLRLESSHQATSVYPDIESTSVSGWSYCLCCPSRINLLHLH